MRELLVGEYHVTVAKEQARLFFRSGPQFWNFPVFGHVLSFACKRVGYQFEQNYPKALHIEFVVRLDFGEAKDQQNC